MTTIYRILERGESYDVIVAYSKFTFYPSEEEAFKTFATGLDRSKAMEIASALNLKELARENQ
jgi:hypothetical protein